MIPKSKLLIGCLYWLNSKNRDRREKNFYKSLVSMKNLKDQDCDTLAFINCCDEVAEKDIKSQEGIDYSIFMDQNYYEMSVIYLGAKVAKEKGYEYYCYMYDDFVVYNDNFAKDCIDFMDEHLDVGCLRIPAYDFKNKNLYNSEITAKSVNPDSIRHFNTETRKNLSWQGPFKYGKNDFYKCNWHYTSRPTIWRTDLLLSFFDDLKDIPIMQFFEGSACANFAKTNLLTGVLDGGSMHTFLESERKLTPESEGIGVFLKKEELDNFLSKSKISSFEIDKTN